MQADFYLATNEGYGLENPRQCRAIKRLKDQGRDDYLLVNVSPPVSVEWISPGESGLDQVVFATRHADDSLFPIQHWPVLVYVCRLLVRYEGQDEVRSDDIECIAWAELYPTEEAARERTW